LWLARIAIAIWYDRWRTKSDSVLIIIPALTATFIATILVWSFTYERLFDFDTAMDLLQVRADFDIQALSLMVHYRSVEENIAYTTEIALSERRLAGLALGLAVLAGSTKLLLVVLCPSEEPRSKPQKFILAAFALAPLDLFFIGHDHGRWLSMLNANVVFLFMFAAARDGIRLSNMTESMTITMLIFTLVFVMIGPFGVAAIFPQAQLWSLLSSFASAFDLYDG